MINIINNLLGKFTQFNSWKATKQYFAISIAPLVLLGIIYAWQNVKDNNAGESQVLSITSASDEQNPSHESSLSQSVQDTSIFVDVSGAVNVPGIKTLSVHARVNDAIWSAEGYTDQADKQYLAQVLNLAQPLNDGDKIYIPTYVEVAQSLPDPPTLFNKINEPINVISGAVAGISSSSGNQDTSSDKASKININTATQSKLEELPGIGEVNAKNIIEGRPYNSTNELCSRKIITNSTTCEKIQDLITF